VQPPLRVAYVVTRSDQVGGANVHVRDLASWLRARGHEAKVWVGGSGPFLDLLHEAGVPFEVVPSLRREIRPATDAAAALQLLLGLRRWRPDVLSLHTAKAGAVGRWIGPTIGAATLYTAHGWSFAPGVPVTEARRHLRFERWLARMPGLIVDVCEHDRALAVGAGVGRDERHVVVHNGMPDRTDVTAAHPERQPPRLVMVARFEAQKDHATLLRALASLDPESSWRLTLIGDGHGRDRASRLADDLGIGRRIEWAGALPDVAPTLATAQAFVLASHWEGFPRSILEAMRAGLPVIASDVGGTREAVIDGETGYVVPPGDVMALADALGRLIAAPDLRARMGAAGRSRFANQFTFERMAARTLALYLQVSGRVATPPSDSTPEA